MIIAIRRQPRRRGMTVVALLVCLILVTLITAAILKISRAQHEFTRAEERRLQAEWLVESGVERSLAALEANREYAGETWPVSAHELGLPSEGRKIPGKGDGDPPAAVVTITVNRVADNPLRRQIRVQADYRRDSPRGVRHSKQITIDLGPTKAGVKP
jgi:hypothetical protein